MFSTDVVLGAVQGPNTAAGFVTATVTCPTGSVSLGGGILTLPPPDSAQPSPLHVDGSYPSVGGGQPVANGSTASSWTAVAEEGASVGAGTQTEGFALCGGGGGSTANLVKVKTAPGPLGGNGYVTVTVDCPAGPVLLGGGANTVAGIEGVAGGQPSPLHLVGSYPSGILGTAAPVSGSIAGSWTAVAEEGADTSSPTNPTTTTAFAVCGLGGAISGTFVSVASTPGPSTSSGFARATATCPSGSTLLGGGAFTDAPPGTPQPSPLHLDGSFPSDSGGTAVSLPGTSVDSWSALSETGNGFAGVTTSAYAMCGR
jgi:hypothetical protein